MGRFTGAVALKDIYDGRRLRDERPAVGAWGHRRAPADAEVLARLRRGAVI